MTKYKKGNLISCKITAIKKFGCFVNIDDKYKGLIHISEISDRYVKNINEYVKLNDIIKAKIIDIDEKNFKINLSLKKVNRSIFNILKLDRGFKPLKEKLPKWIKDKLKEYDK